MNLTKKLPAVLQTIPFWVEFAEGIQAELERLKNEFRPIEDYFDPDSKDTIDEFRDYYSEFGMSVNIMLFEQGYPANIESINEYLKREANALAFMIRKKGTKDFFDHIFNRIYKLGFSYVMFTDNSNKRVSLFRALENTDTEGSILRELLSHNASLPFVKVYPNIPFKEGLSNIDTLDSVKELKLDDTPSWNLDSSLIARGVSNTTHVALEFMISESVVIDSVTQLVDNRYLEYLRNSIEFGRKASQIPHFGANLSCWFKKGVAHSVSALGMTTQCSASVGPDVLVITDLYHQLIMKKTGGIPVYIEFLSSNEITRTLMFDLINFSIPAKSIYPELISLVTNSSIITYSKTIETPPIIPKSFRVYFEDINSVSHVIKDDGNGLLYFEEYEDDLLDEGYSGTVDYVSGAISVTLQTIHHTYYPKLNSEINSYYKTGDDISIVGIQILDSTETEVLSATFNPVILNSPDYHISFTCIVDRR